MIDIVESVFDEITKKIKKIFRNNAYFLSAKNAIGNARSVMNEDMK